MAVALRLRADFYAVSFGDCRVMVLGQKSLRRGTWSETTPESGGQSGQQTLDNTMITPSP